MATQSSILAWKIPWMEEPGGLRSTGSQRVRYDWAASLSTFFHFLEIMWKTWCVCLQMPSSLWNKLLFFIRLSKGKDAKTIKMHPQHRQKCIKPIPLEEELKIQVKLTGKWQYKNKGEVIYSTVCKKKKISNKLVGRTGTSSGFRNIIY